MKRKGVALQIRISDENAAVLRAMAKRENRSPSNYLAALLAAHIRTSSLDLSDCPVSREGREGVITGGVDPKRPETWPKQSAAAEAARGGS